MDEHQEQRHKQVQWALALTAGTSLAPSAYELELLTRYVEGELTIEQVIILLEEQS